MFCLSSVNEGLPLVIMEAMAAGLPIISTNVGGIPEVVSETAWLCPPGDADALAGAMLHAVNYGDLQKLGEIGQLLATSKLGMEHMAAGYLELYRRL